jgi:hypothetical protein
MFAKASHSTIKDIHLALEVKRGNLHTKVTKQNLSDYAQQDWLVVTKRPDF